MIGNKHTDKFPLSFSSSLFLVQYKPEYPPFTAYVVRAPQMTPSGAGCHHNFDVSLFFDKFVSTWHSVEPSHNLWWKRWLRQGSIECGIQTCKDLLVFLPSALVQLVSTSDWCSSWLNYFWLIRRTEQKASYTQAIEGRNIYYFVVTLNINAPTCAKVFTITFWSRFIPRCRKKWSIIMIQRALEFYCQGRLHQ